MINLPHNAKVKWLARQLYALDHPTYTEVIEPRRLEEYVDKVEQLLLVYAKLNNFAHPSIMEQYVQGFVTVRKGGVAR